MYIILKAIWVFIATFLSRENSVPVWSHLREPLFLINSSSANLITNMSLADHCCLQPSKGKEQALSQSTKPLQDRNRII